MRRLIGARHQLGQLHRAGCSFSLLTRGGDTQSQKSQPVSCLDTCTQSLLPPPSQFPDPGCLTSCQTPHHSSEGWRHFLATIYPSLVLLLPFLAVCSHQPANCCASGAFQQPCPCTRSPVTRLPQSTCPKLDPHPLCSCSLPTGRCLLPKPCCSAMQQQL